MRMLEKKKFLINFILTSLIKIFRKKIIRLFLYKNKEKKKEKKMK
jgi:hypothetical protein